jgi:FAD/FMN-containing dehydrogenases
MDTALHQTLERVRAAVADSSPLRIRGGGSKDFHALQLQGAILDTRSLHGIVSYEPSELVVTVRAGTPLAELEAALAEQGQCWPLSPRTLLVWRGMFPPWAAWWLRAGVARRAPAWVPCVTLCWD